MPLKFAISMFKCHTTHSTGSKTKDVAPSHWLQTLMLNKKLKWWGGCSLIKKNLKSAS